MARFVPSDVVALIDRFFPDAAGEVAGIKPIDILLTVETATHIATIASMVDQIPDALLRVDRRDFADLMAAVTGLRMSIEAWHNRSHQRIPHTFVPAIPSRDFGAIPFIRRILTACPDEAPALSTSDLAFITDDKFREVLRTDISAMESAIAGAEWKAATVLAGSVIEALLLWALQHKVDPALLATCSKNPRRDIERWDLYDYIEVARELNAITPMAADQARIAREFRNLIHPGRTLRVGQHCDKGTAFSASAAVYILIRELS